MRYGVFLGPWHDTVEDPTLAIHRDMELMEFLDTLGFDEAWIGEHHSGGWELIGSPELFIAAAAERTSRLRFGTGVISLPYHNPFMVADRIVQLDHMTRGRVMFGFGPGLLPSDALMIGVEPETTRERMAEALEVILRLLDGEVVTKTTDWFKLQNARLHLLPFTAPRPEIAVASTTTPSGGKLAGRYGLSMLCTAATNRLAFDALEVNWRIARETAAEHGKTVENRHLRLVAPMHIAETREQARANVRERLPRYIEYQQRITPLFDIPADSNPIDTLVDSKYAVVGTPEDGIRFIQRLIDKQGEFGGLLLQAINWADFAATKRSYELIARYIVPHFSRANHSREASYDWLGQNRSEFTGRWSKSRQMAIDKYQSEHPPGRK